MSVEAQLQHWHQQSEKNRGLIERAKYVGCFFCHRIVATEEVLNRIEWVGPDGQTGLCPFCEMDTLLPNPNPSLLQAMHDRYFKGISDPRLV